METTLVSPPLLARPITREALIQFLSYHKVDWEKWRPGQDRTLEELQERLNMFQAELKYVDTENTPCLYANSVCIQFFNENDDSVILHESHLYENGPRLRPQIERVQLRFETYCDTKDRIRYNIFGSHDFPCEAVDDKPRPGVAVWQEWTGISTWYHTMRFKCPVNNYIITEPFRERHPESSSIPTSFCWRRIE